MPAAVLVLLLCVPEVTLGEGIKVRGAGASFPNEVYKNWLPTYTSVRQPFVKLDMTYEVTGSSKGKERIQEFPEVVDYAGSDYVLNEQEQRDFPDLKIFPSLAGYVFGRMTHKAISY